MQRLLYISLFVQVSSVLASPSGKPAMEEHAVVPDVIDVAPPATIKVTKHLNIFIEFII